MLIIFKEILNALCIEIKSYTFKMQEADLL